MKIFVRKIFVLVLLFLFIAAGINVQAGEKMYENQCNTLEEQKQIQDDAKNPMPPKACEKCIVEDDEYCIYNQCYFDKQYRNLKTDLMPDNNQENCLDNIYVNFKQDLEILCERCTREKNKLLEMIASDQKYLREQKTLLNDVKSDIKEKYKDYLSETNEILNKNQRKIFKKFKKSQNKKIKAIKKYGAIYKLPCS